MGDIYDNATIMPIIRSVLKYHIILYCVRPNHMGWIGKCVTNVSCFTSCYYNMLRLNRYDTATYGLTHYYDINNIAHV